MPCLRVSRVKPLGVTSLNRVKAAPEIPAIAETGYPGYEATTWYGVLAPAGTPREIVNRLSAEAAKAINESDIKDRFNQIGIEPAGNNPEQAARFLADEIAKWAKVITTAGVKAEQ